MFKLTGSKVIIFIIKKFKSQLTLLKHVFQMVIKIDHREVLLNLDLIVTWGALKYPKAQNDYILQANYLRMSGVGTTASALSYPPRWSVWETKLKIQHFSKNCVTVGMFYPTASNELRRLWCCFVGLFWSGVVETISRVWPTPQSLHDYLGQACWEVSCQGLSSLAWLAFETR